MLVPAVARFFDRRWWFSTMAWGLRGACDRVSTRMSSMPAMASGMAGAGCCRGRTVTMKLHVHQRRCILSSWCTMLPMESETSRERLVVIGNGMAGMRTVEELLKLDPTRYDITVFGAEPHVNYDRITLSSVLAGEKQVDDIVINPRSWYDENHIVLHAGDAVVAIDPAARTVTARSGLTVGYDRLLLATGSKPIVPPIPGLNLPGVCAFRDIKD